MGKRKVKPSQKNQGKLTNPSDLAKPKKYHELLDHRETLKKIAELEAEVKSLKEKIGISQPKQNPKPKIDHRLRKPNMQNLNRFLINNGLLTSRLDVSLDKKVDALSVFFNKNRPTKKKRWEWINGLIGLSKIKLKKSRQELHKQRYHAYLRSDEWKQIREFIIKERVKCERCGSKEELQVHHKTYDNVFNEKMEDLELLCKCCHRKEHGLPCN